MSLMSINLLYLVDSAVLLIATVVIQGVVIVFFAVKVVFRMLGSDYDAAVMTGGFIGLGLGATPVAMANMDAVSQKYGPSIKAFLVVPLVGAFFIDLINAAVIGSFLRMPFLQ
jgi:ESS family glutamate:Na+ symporter